MDWWQPTILVDVKRDLLDVVSLLINAILGSAAVYSLWLSRKVLKKSEFDSAMSTSPSIIIRPRSIYVGVKQKEEYAGYGVVDGNGIIKKDSEIWEIIFCIEFECFNAGRGAAFNISQPKVRDTRLLQRSGKIEYSQEPYE